MLRIQTTTSAINKYLFILVIGALSSHLIYSLFTTNPKLILDTVLIDLILMGVFLLAIIKINYAFFASLLLLPFFFFLENLTVISQVYQSQTSLGFSFYAIDPRIIGFTLTTFFATLLIYQKRKQFKEIFTKSSFLKIVFLVIGYFLLTTLWSIDDLNKYVQLSFYILLVSLFLLSYLNIKNNQSLYHLGFFVIALSLPAILLSYYQIFGGIFYEYSDLNIKRVSGPFDSPNLLGSFLLIGLALSLILLFHFYKKNIHKYNFWLISYLFITIPIFIMTFSRSAWLGLVIFLGIFSLQKKRFVLAGVLIFILLLPGLLMFEPTRTRIDGFSEHTMFDSMYARKNIWHLSSRKFIEHPFLGYGAGSFSEVINDAKESANGTDNPHNDLVFFSIEGGLTGIFLYVLLISSFYYQIIKKHLTIKSAPLSKLSKTDKEAYLVLSWGVLALLLSFTLISTVESYYEANFLHLITWSLLAGWLALPLDKIYLHKITNL